MDFPLCLPVMTTMLSFSLIAHCMNAQNVPIELLKTITVASKFGQSWIKPQQIPVIRILVCGQVSTPLDKRFAATGFYSTFVRNCLYFNVAESYCIHTNNKFQLLHFASSICCSQSLEFSHSDGCVIVSYYNLQFTQWYMM